jgi:hypothetical protein
MLQIMAANEVIDRLVRCRWVQLATFNSATAEIHLFRKGEFVAYRPLTDQLPEAESSLDWYRGWRDHLGFASIRTRAGSRFRLQGDKLEDEGTA